MLTGDKVVALWHRIKLRREIFEKTVRYEPDWLYWVEFRKFLSN